MSSDENRDTRRVFTDYDREFPALRAPLESIQRSLEARLRDGNRQLHRSADELFRSFVGRSREPPANWNRSGQGGDYGHAIDRPGQTWEEGNAHLHLRNLLDHLHGANERLASSLSNNEENNNNMASSTASGSRPREVQQDNRRSKRRKIDSDGVTDFAGFRYGKYGQVEPGPLKMEIVSCDGSMFLNESINAAENILTNDASVYCTNGNRCNIVLRHQGATVFNLTELVIKAPGPRYSSPVREGMVFISMNDNDQLSRTADYRIQYGAAKSDARGGDGGNESRSRDHDSRRLAPILTWRRRDGTVGVTSRNSLLGFGLDDDDDRDRDEDDEEDDEEEGEDEEEEEDDEDEYMYEARPYRTAQMPREFTTTSHPPFNITTECTDDDPADGPLRIARSGGAPNRSERLYMTDSSGEEDEDDADADADFAHGPLFGQEPTRGGYRPGWRGQRTLVERERERERQRQLEQDRQLERELEEEERLQAMEESILAREESDQMGRDFLRRRQERNERRLLALQSRISALERGRNAREEEEAEEDEEENHTEAEGRNGIGDQPARPTGEGLMAPHAKFNIEQGRSKCTIKFDPPVSGRFILLKMWSPHPDRSGNIDIQTVMAKGYAGPRYFPSVSLL